MLAPAFSFHLNNQILPRHAVVGKFDGKTPSLACVTTGGKIVLHSPHDSNSNDNNNNNSNYQPQDSAVRFLNFNRKVTALAVGSLNKKSNDRDLLFVGTQTNLLAYDIERNSDVFFKECQDGVSSLAIGMMGTQAKPLVLAGGNCSVLGFDAEGTESFWTVTGDNVSSMMISDVNGDGIRELVVGSDDFEIRTFKNEEIIDETSETEKVTFLVPVQGNMFAYGLANGTVGVYSGSKNRLWRVKTKNKVVALDVFDIDGDGVPEILIGWSNGAFQCRKAENGEVVHKDKFTSPIAAIVCSDYRMDGKTEVMICFETGEVKAFVPAEADMMAMANLSAGYADNAISLESMRANAEDQKAIIELQEKKQALSNELKSLEKASKSLKSGASSADTAVGALPGQTALNFTLLPDLASSSLSLRVNVTTDVVIANIVAVDLEGGVLEGTEVLAITPNALKSAVLPLRPSKFQPCTIRIQTHLTSRTLTQQLHVFEKEISIPKFSTFLSIPMTRSNNGIISVDSFAFSAPSSRATFTINETTAKLAEYIKSVFIVHDNNNLKVSAEKLRAQFVSVCGQRDATSKQRSTTHGVFGGGTVLTIYASTVESNKSAMSNQNLLEVQLECDSVEIVSEFIQDMCKALKFSELSTVADFPDEFAAFAEVLERVDNCNSMRLRLAADMADDSQRIKALIVRAEDSRLLSDMKTMKRAYTDLYNLNNQLIANYSVRSSNHELLLQSLKEVNHMIQKTANLRNGKSKSNVISECRTAVKTNNIRTLLQIMKSGSSAKQ